MKIFTKEQIYAGDTETAKKQNISSADLMERAGIQIFNWLHVRMQGAQVPIHVFCGIGNNGGDGLVVARHLITHGYNVHTYVVNCSTKRSKDFLVNYESEFVRAYKINAIPRFLLIDPAGNIVDADAPRPSEDKLIELFNSLEI